MIPRRADGGSLLERLRSNVDAWACVRFEADGDDDANEHARADVLAALVRDLRAEDVALARFLLVEETRRLRATYVMSDAIRLAVLAVGMVGDVGDIWAIWNAKGANGSTSIGLENDIVGTRDVAATVAYVRETPHPDQADLLAFFGDSSDERLAAWQTAWDELAADYGVARPPPRRLTPSPPSG